MTPAQIRSVQKTLNRFTRKYLRGVAPLRVDGVRGRSTNSRILLVKFYLGYGERDTSWKPLTVRRIRHPRSRKYSSARMIATGLSRRTRQRARWRQQQAASVVAPGVTRFDGVPVAKWMVPYLRWARAHGWAGRLVSGWRSPAYSDSLCRRMCGRPSCPGRCAGRASNHAGSARPRGALDVSDYYRFGSLMRRCPYSPRIFNALGARDPVHFSQSGN